MAPPPAPPRAPGDRAGRPPSIDRLLRDERLQRWPRALALRAARQEVEARREDLLQGGLGQEALVEAIERRLEALSAPAYRPVLNLTGVVVHTNLGRAPLHPRAARAAAALGAGYCDLELDLESGRRGSRLAALRERLRSVAGAEAALAVNNGAAAVLLALTALARGGEVLVSRGELVEIGGSFRVPEVIAAGGARLREVGATNRTRVQDYAAAIGPETSAILRVHPSNFRMIGFTERPPRPGLAALARAHGLPLIEDLGSGLLGELPPGVPGEEESVGRALAEGADLVCCSGDKLLGGPQAGLMLGRAALVERCGRHPLYRALRLDKLVLAALDATLALYEEGRQDEIPVRRALGRRPEELRAAARRLAERLPGARVEADQGHGGGGALAGWPLPGFVVALPHPRPDELARALRLGWPAVLARVGRDALLLDPRTLLDGEEAVLLSALAAQGVEVRAAAQDADGGPR